MKTIQCPSCKRIVNIEPEHRGFGEVNAGHGRIIDEWKRPSELQCMCGKHVLWAAPTVYQFAA
jgi:endogenous inhibitor of DNA gyrase (YacG/DUF329 family)